MELENTSKLKSDNTIDIIIEANDTESGIKEILLSDGTRLDLNNPKINVSENGIYKFIVTDNAGNITESIININNINDKNNDISKIPNAGGFTSLTYLSSLITIAGSYSLLRKRKND